MHDAERADEHAKADAAPEAEKRDHGAEIQNRFGKEQDTVQHVVDPIFPETAARPRFPNLLAF
ncbi:hypothetical protein [Mesorhizobium sp. B2-8-5]|uniref:hypothetical protein n=1 Tax=Mesorhizobium sp. B2-8-5 TaxID=2589903 RepID=UPI0015E39D4C|nr:hypothetical protein [Mesorhizobium sp. B2-8-5]UCI29214.1 hypothetical protein FJ430_15590 [Mesorhizobium sp. B2-8-5]